MAGMRVAKSILAGAAGFLAGLALLRFAAGENIRHLAVIVMVAAPVIAFRHAMKEKIAPHCPRPLEPGSPQ
jgi:hypothetical protein